MPRPSPHQTEQQMANATRRRMAYDLCKVQGICPRCRHPWAGPQVLCLACRDQAAKTYHLRKRLPKYQGKCAHCGRANADAPARLTCPTCRATARAAYARRQGRPPSPGGDQRQPPVPHGAVVAGRGPDVAVQAPAAGPVVG